MSRRQVYSVFAGLAIVLFLVVGGYIRLKHQRIENPAHWGETMGTTYSIKITGKVSRPQLDLLLTDVKKALDEVNRQMSTWDPESEISTFNHSDSTTPVPCSTGFVSVVDRALALSAQTGGAFDPTLQPLLNLWGFGSEGDERQIPSDASIAAVLDKTGWEKISIQGQALQKTDPGLSLALGAIAKGYGVDIVADVMRDHGYDNWFVEIGGEVVASGVNGSGVPWRVGIQMPTTNPMDQSLWGIVHITEGAVATSGDYRNYIEEEGILYSHILDPRTGRTVLSDTASVSVYAKNCMDADGAATALFVMGYEEGLKWVEQQDGLEAMFLIRTNEGEIIQKISSGFEAATGYIKSL